MLYTSFFQASTTLNAQLLAGGTSATLLSGVFGSPTGTQLLVIDGNVPAKREVVACTISGTAITGMIRGLDGTSGVQHEVGATVSFNFVPTLFSALAQFDGWIPFSEAATYATASTFTVTGLDLTSIISKGDKLKLNNTTLKYFYVTGVSFGGGDTTVTVTGGSDYSLANAAITSVYYSKLETPNGFPDWFSYTPSFTGFSANPTMTSRFKLSGTKCTVQQIGVSAGTSNAVTYTTTVPITAKYSHAYIIARVRNNGAFLATPGVATTTAASTTVGVFRDALGTAFTASGEKRADFTIDYEIN